MNSAFAFGIARRLYAVGAAISVAPAFVNHSVAARYSSQVTWCFSMIPLRDAMTSLKMASSFAQAGVKIYEYLPTMHHAKTIVGDESFSAIGTMNFDNRSMSFNDESMFLTYDAGCNDRLAKVFLEDLEFSEQYTFTMWRQRPLWMRTASKMAYSLRRVL